MTLPGIEPVTIILKSASFAIVPRSSYNIYIRANIYRLDLTSSRLVLTISD